MDIASGEVTSIDIGRPSPLTFTHIDEASQWIEQEKAAWAWLNDSAASSIAQNTGNISNLINKRLNAIQNSIQPWRDNSNNRQQFISAVENAYRSTRIPFSTDPIFLAAKRLADSGDSAAGAAAIAAELGHLRFGPEQPINRSIFRGIAAAEASSASLPAAAGDIAASLQKLAEQFSERAARFDGIIARADADLENFLRSAEINLTQIAAEIEHIWNDKIESSIRDIKATEAAYKQDMQLKASVDYWKQRATEHRKRAKSVRAILIWYCSLGTFVLAGALIVLSVIASKSSTGSNDLAVFFKFAAVGAVLTTIGLWVGRTLLRVFLSERHLATDADERGTMVLTYLALTNEQKIEPSDRALVLAPLFRSASDGIVKDDGPDATLAGIIARVVDSKAR
jgi:hypothetical protein